MKWRMATGIVPLVLLAILAWATRFKYETMHYGPQLIDIRTNRFTDETEKLTMAGWKEMVAEEPSPPVDHTERDLQLENCVVTTKTHEAFVECVDKVLP